MKQLMAVFMLLLATVMALPHAVFAEGNNTTNVTDDDGTEDQGSGDAPGSESDDDTETEDESDDDSDDGAEAETETEDESEDESEDSSEDEASDDDGTDDQGSGDVQATAAEVSASAEDDAEHMDTTLGSQVRLLQLERQIQRSILHMQAVVNVIENSNNTNTSNKTAAVVELKSIIAEMQTLKLEAGNAVNNTTDKEVALKVFLEIKADAKALVGEFRDTARPWLAEGDLRGLKGQFEDIDKSSLKAIDEKIKQLKRDRDAERLQAFLDAAGLTNAELVAEVKSGETSLSDARKWIKDQVKELDESERKELRNKLEEKRIKDRVEARDLAIKQREKLLERLEIRSEERARELEKKGLESRSERKEKVVVKLDERGDKLQERRERIETRVRENINGERVETRTETRVRVESSGSISVGDDSDSSGSGSEDDNRN